MESQEAFKDLFLSENTSSILSFLSCLAGKTPGKNVGTPTRIIVVKTTSLTLGFTFLPMRTASLRFVW
jgi:hypothetical protein